MKSRNSSRRPEYFSYHNGIKDNKEQPDKVVDKNSIVKKSRQKEGGLRSLKVLVAILLSHMGRMGARDFLSLVAIVNMVYYKISHVDGRTNNPEQGIASDVPKFCSELSDLVQEDLTAVTDGAGTMIRNFSPVFGKLMSQEQHRLGMGMARLFYNKPKFAILD